MQDKGWMDGRTGKGLTTGKRQTAGLERQCFFFVSFFFLLSVSFFFKY